MAIIEKPETVLNLIIVILTLVIGLFIGGILKEYYLTGFATLGIKFTDVITLAFTGSIVYFTTKQYYLEYFKSLPSIKIQEYVEDPHEVFIENVGGRPAYNVECTFFGDPDSGTVNFKVYDKIDALGVKTPRKFLIPKEYCGRVRFLCQYSIDKNGDRDVKLDFKYSISCLIL